MKRSKEMLTKPWHWRDTKYPFISYLQLFTQEGPAEPEEAPSASCDAWPCTPGLRGSERSPTCVPWTQTYVNGIGAALGMLLNEKVCFKCTSPYSSIAKHTDLAKYSEKHTFQKYRHNLYILTTASRCILEHLEIITKMKIIFLYWALCLFFVSCVVTMIYGHNFRLV